jgi:hypothetical protein
MCAPARRTSVFLTNNDSGLIIDAGYPGKALRLEFTVDDDGVFTMPWSATMTYRRAAGAWPEFVCSENIRSTITGRTPKSRALTIFDRSIAAPPSGLSSCANDEAPMIITPIGLPTRRPVTWERSWGNAVGDCRRGD